MNWEDIEAQFDVTIPPDVPVFPMNVACKLLHMQYHLLHEIMKAGLLEQENERRKKQEKKLLSKRQIQRLRYIQYLIEEKGVNLSGVKMIIMMGNKE